MQESATKYRSLLESIDEGFCICEMLFDENGKPSDYRFLEVNSGFENLTGLEDATGKTARELVPDIEAYWFEIYSKVVQTGERIRFEQETRAMNRWFNVNAFPIGEPEANQFAVLFTNITEAKRIEEERNLVEQERQRFLAVGSDLQVITRSDGYFQWVSPTFERTLGWTLHEMTSRPWIDFVHPDDIPESLSETDSLLSGNETIAFENRYRHKNGSYRWFLWNAQPYLEEEVIYGAAVDISDRKRAELNIEFLANVTQELVGATNVDEIVQTIGSQLNRYLNTSICALVEIDQRAWQAVINHDWHQNDVPSLVGVYSLREFVTDEFLRIAQSGQPIVVRNVAVDPRIADPQRYTALKIGAQINIPLIRDGEWKFSLTVFHQTPYNWREDEIELMRELANRIWAQVERARAEAALRESRAELERQLQKFDVTLSTITDLVFSFDRDGRVVYANQGLLDLWGVTATYARGKTLAQLSYPEAVERQVMENVRRVFETGETVRDETPYANSSGANKGDGYFEYILNPVFANDGTVKIVAGSSRNITDRKQAELALRSSEEQRRNIIDSITDAFFAVDENWRFTYVNQTAALLVNRAPSELIGKIFWEEFPGVNNSKFEQMHRSVMRDRVAQSLTEFYSDHNRWYEVRSYPAANGITIYFRNVTDQIQADAALRQTSAELERQLQKFNAVVSAVPDFIYTFDLSGRFIDANKPLLDLLQKSFTEVIGKNFFELDYPVDLAGKLHLQIQEVIETRQPIKDETPFTGAFGPRIYEYIFVPIFNAEGAVEMVAGVTRDITQHKQAEAEREKLLQQEQAAREAAEQANRIKDEFLAVLSHELRSPLNPILGWTKLLQSAKLDAQRQAEALATIERNAKLQAQLIEDLLDISRIMQGKLSLNAAPVSLTFVISAAVETVRLAAEAKNILLELDLDSDIASISGDATRLQQVVWNLLTNAVKFTPQGGRVTVELRQMDAVAQIRVIDTGKGIKPQFLPYVFEYFRQEDGSTTRKFGGLGLGLAIVRQIVEMHGGTVRAESQVRIKVPFQLLNAQVVRQA